MPVNNRISVCIILFFCCILPGYSQRDGNDPYSSIGIGSQSNKAFYRNITKGGAGVSDPDKRFTNHLNPALLTFNKLVVFDAGAGIQRQTLKSESGTNENYGGNLNYLSITLPILDNITSNIGIKPYSSVNYKFSTTQSLDDSTHKEINQNLNGSGGLTRVFIANGFDISKNVKLGLEASYIFGSIEHQFNSQLTSQSRDRFSDQFSYSGWAFKGGAFYRKKLVDNEDLEKDVYLNGGLTYEINPAMKTEHLRTLEKINTNSSQPRTVFEDTLTSGKAFHTLPQEWRIGLTYQKPRNWSLALDVSLSNWNNYQSMRGSDSLGNAYNIALGGEYTPDYNAVDNYWNRVTYRAGLQYGKTPFVIGEQPIHEASLNFGATFPMAGKESSLLTLGFSIGRRDFNQEYFTQDFIKAHIGFTIRDKWFTERKIR